MRKLHQRQEWCHLMFRTKFLTLLPKNIRIAISFMSPVGGKIQQNVVLTGCERNSHSDKILFEFIIFADRNLQFITNS